MVQWSVPLAFDPTISLGSLLTAVSVALGAIAFIWTMKSDIKGLDGRVGRIEETIAKVTETLVQLARQEARQDGLESRIGRAERQIDDLARGEGYVLPIKRSTREIGGE